MGVNCVFLCSLFCYTLPSDNRFSFNSDLSGGEPICLTAGLLSAQMRLLLLHESSFFSACCFVFSYLSVFQSSLSTIGYIKKKQKKTIRLKSLNSISTSPQVSSRNACTLRCTSLIMLLKCSSTSAGNVWCHFSYVYAERKISWVLGNRGSFAWRARGWMQSQVLYQTNPYQQAVSTNSRQG